MAFGLFKKKKKEEKTDQRYRILRIREVVKVAEEAVNLVFEKPEEPFVYQPGQFLTLIHEVNGKKIRRAYSLCTTPFEDEFPAVTVKRVPDGRMSNHINDHFKAGDEVEVMEPMGMFTTDYDESRSRHAIFIGGGSGVTPLYSLLRSILVREPKSKVGLIYGNRSEEFVIFRQELERLRETHGDRFRMIQILENDPGGITSYTGRPTTEMIGAIVDELNVTPDTEFYICGPEPMMEIANAGLKQIGINDTKIRKESFEAGKTSPSDILGDPKEARSVSMCEVTILLNGEEHIIQVPSDTPILEAGLENGLDMPYSCQSGLCTACRGKCLEGEISLDEAEGLSQEEIDEHYRLLCVGKPKSEKVTVEVG